MYFLMHSFFGVHQNSGIEDKYRFTDGLFILSTQQYLPELNYLLPGAQPAALYW